MDRFSKIDRNVDRFGYWVGAITIMTGVFSWIAKQMDAYHLGWPEAFFIGLLAAGFLVLIVSVGLIGWRFFSPIGGVKPGRTSDGTTIPVRAITEDDASAMIELRIAALLAETLPSRFETHAQAHARDEKIVELSDRIDAVRQLAEGSHESITYRLENHGMDIRSLEEQAAQMKRDFDAWVHQHNQDQEWRFTAVDGGFKAIRDREVLYRLAGQIEAQAKWLLQSAEGKQVDWMQYGLKRSQWQDNINSYCLLAQYYLSDVPTLIRHVPADELRGDWPEDRSLFPSDDAMLAHRTDTIIMRNFRAQHDRVIDCVSSFAFNRPSMKKISEN